MTTRVILCDDHALIRRGIRDTLSDAADIQVVGEAADYGELRALILACKERQGLGLVPLLGDLLLGSAAAVVRDRWPGGPALLVPVPSARATVAERGQITLPKAVRDALGLTKGSVLKVELEGSRIVLSKHVDDAISRVRGKFALDATAGKD